MPTVLRRALISVSDKTGVIEFARALAARGVAILSTGGTARLLTEQGIAVTEVSKNDPLDASLSSWCHRPSGACGAFAAAACC